MSTSQCTAASVQRAFRASVPVQMSAIFPVDRRSPPLGALGVVAMGALASEASRVETMMFGLLVSAV